MYDIWTFTDASTAINEHTHSRTGVYGFVHMCVDQRGGNLVPFQTGFESDPARDIDVLECHALRLALTNIQSSNYSCRFGIFVDSDNVYNNVNAISKGMYPKWCNNPDNEFRLQVLHVGKMYAKMLHTHNLNMFLVKSHVREWGEQIRYFKSKGINIDAQFAKNVCIGNSYVDYYVSNIARCQHIPSLEPYNSFLNSDFWTQAKELYGYHDPMMFWFEQWKRIHEM